MVDIVFCVAGAGVCANGDVGSAGGPRRDVPLVLAVVVASVVQCGHAPVALPLDPEC